MCLEMFEQGIFRIGFIEDPFIKCVGVDFATEIFFEFFLLMSLINDFSWFKALEEFISIFAIALSEKKFAGGEIEKGESIFFIGGEMNGGQKIIAVVFE